MSTEVGPTVDETHDKMVTEEFTVEQESHQEDEHLVSVNSSLAPGRLTVVCICGRLKIDGGVYLTLSELTKIASDHIVPGVNA